MKVRQTGTHAVLEDMQDRQHVFDLLDGPFSYMVAGAEYSDAYVRKVWDGRKRLVQRAPGIKLHFPIGLLDQALRIFDKEGVEYTLVDERRSRPWSATEAAWVGHPLRPHQEEAVAAALAAPGGVLDQPVRSGKTLMAARITFELKQRAVFVAPSDFLVAQARSVFQAAMRGPRVSVVGLGEDDPTGDVVIASIATLCARRATRWWRDFFDSFGVVFFDELHHLLGLGEEWRDTALGISAARRYGLTGTLYADDPQVRLWAHALCGPVVHRTTMKRLTDAGHLSPLTIRFVRHNAPTSKEREWSPSTYKHHVVECEQRNARLVREALEYAAAGRHVLIDVSRVGHGRELLRILRGHLRPGEAKLLTGSSSDDERRSTIADFVSRKVKVLVSTFLGEGVDIPELDVVINAEGGRASPSTIQRLRNLTPFPGKEAILVEPIDDHHPSLAGWTKERVMLYRAERCFKITIEPATADTPERKLPVKDKVKFKIPPHLAAGPKE